MKASKFSDAQKAFILKQGADGVPVADICRKAGMSQSTSFNKKKYDGLLTTEMQRWKFLEDENVKVEVRTLRQHCRSIAPPRDDTPHAQTHYETNCFFIQPLFSDRL